MDTKKVWGTIKGGDIPKIRKIIKRKWILKVKRNEIFRARLVAFEYIQVSGVDLNESFAPEINDASFRIILISKLI
jgi:hypothetical protein